MFASLPYSSAVANLERVSSDDSENNGDSDAENDEERDGSNDIGTEDIDEDNEDSNSNVIPPLNNQPLISR